MAQYEIKEDNAGVSIELTSVTGQEQSLLKTFGECQAGQCSCHTDEYEKLASMKIAQAPDRIELRLEAKPGEHFHVDEIEACLDYTTEKAGKKNT